MAADPNSIVQEAVDVAIGERGEIGLQVTAYLDDEPVVDVWGGWVRRSRPGPAAAPLAVARRKRAGSVPTAGKSAFEMPILILFSSLGSIL
jgi:hypothetical protein